MNLDERREYLKRKEEEKIDIEDSFIDEEDKINRKKIAKEKKKEETRLEKELRRMKKDEKRENREPFNKKILFVPFIILFILAIVYFYPSHIKPFISSINLKENEAIEDIEPEVVETEIPIVEETETIKENETYSVNNERMLFYNDMVDYAISLNEIIEGENLCISKLSNNIMTTSEASIYFDKTQVKKEDLLEEFYDYNVSGEYMAVEDELKEIYLYSINVSKQVKQHYNNSEGKDTIVSDFKNFYNEHTSRIDDFELTLTNFK